MRKRGVIQRACRCRARRACSAGGRKDSADRRWIWPDVVGSGGPAVISDRPRVRSDASRGQVSRLRQDERQVSRDAGPGQRSSTGMCRGSVDDVQVISSSRPIQVLRANTSSTATLTSS